MTKTGRALVSSSRVKGAIVYDSSGHAIGHIHDLSIDKMTGVVQHALVGHGGFLGIHDRFVPIPWDMLHYDTAMEGYIAPLYKSELHAAQSFSYHDLPQFGARAPTPSS